jgi:hypothetical protein
VQIYVLNSHYFPRKIFLLLVCESQYRDTKAEKSILSRIKTGVMSDMWI